MSSTPIPSTAPFNEEEIARLNQVMSNSTPLQRAWLAGFLTGYDVGAGISPQQLQYQTQGLAQALGQVQAAPAAESKTSEPLTIVFATESGNSEKLAADMAKAARKKGFKPNVVDFADLKPADLTKAKKLIVIAATWGEGDPPARAVRAYEELMSDAAPKLDGVEFGVLALGDTAYVDFCGVGKKIDERLEALGGKRAVKRVDCDLDFQTPASKWIESTLDTIAPAPAAGAPASGQLIEVDFGARAPVSDAPFQGEIVDHVNLNSSRSAKETYHVAIGFEGDVAYEPGDALDIYPTNDPGLAEAIMRVTGHGKNINLRQTLVEDRDINTLSLKSLEKFASISPNQAVRDLVANPEKAREWITGRQLIDLLAEFPSRLSISQLYDVTRPLAPRAYSIASAQKEVGDEVHLLVSAVRYEAFGRPRLGVASTYLADRVKKGDKLRAKVKTNKHFRLPEADRDIIMVGPGTGVAPFRAFVQERRAIEAKGRNWLFFGDRQYTHDFLYQLDWQEYQADGYLHAIDLAFSRDTPQKVYVQDKIWSKRKAVIDWLETGAKFYVCGDAKNMAKDVRNSLVRAYADVKALSDENAEAAVRALESEKRYLTDVY
ncbi:sulfite reductase [NADPH] flavoprotein alpha-component [Terrihabitans soli]|uniref:assimilatory sulfite reductase (NADPH) n=1 Tax=Terrihabitans soli TaxID=708113 RepID=A0A6S6QL80_9HYPH|nr:flavodoxin domain-containing protein [Terrihabitans soli]BCJ92093.1 sulfite reductase [NADPH] flavoprotein alpha-component [Terrihabitans soli]